MSASTEPVVAWRGSTDPDAPLVVLLRDPGGRAISAAALTEVSRWLRALTSAP